MIDEIDKKIIAMAQVNGRASYNEFGEAVGLSVSAVNERLKKLQTQGVIAGWGARINPQVIGLDILAFIYIEIDTPQHENEFTKQLNQLSEIEECHHVTGEWSYLMKVRAHNIAELEILLSEKIKSIKGIIKSHTIISLSSPKESGAIIAVR